MPLSVHGGSECRTSVTIAPASRVDRVKANIKTLRRLKKSNLMVGKVMIGLAKIDIGL
jgi:hypothetical protein